ncbi:MAG: phospholipase D-like domain-containing protein [Methanomassiliicoccales archaeon]|nr:phospholipase D-like domain-containing protein [Methanomassiliicoccales archaeon]
MDDDDQSCSEFSQLMAETCEIKGETDDTSVVSRNPFCLLITEIAPSFFSEYVVIGNPLDMDISLLDWSISDREGQLKFAIDFMIKGNEEIILTWNRSSVENIYPQKRVIEINEANFLKSGRFQLADIGDEVLLIDREGHVVDVITYGNSAYTGSGWDGDPVSKIGNKEAAIRRQPWPDTNTSTDWRIEPPGRSHLSGIERSGVIEPFVAPEEARTRIIRELKHAARSVKVSLYELNDKLIVEELCNCSMRGLDVRVLLEGQPVGGLSRNTAESVMKLIDCGAQVHFLVSNNGFKRYKYLHNKYAILDERRIIVMSENWVTEGLDNNRGWGVTVEDQTLASYFSQMFEEDFRLSMADICTAQEYLSLSGNTGAQMTAESALYMSSQGTLSDISVFRGIVRPIVSPDFSYGRLIELINNAKSRILIEQFYCDPCWLNDSEILSSILIAANRGITVRFLLDSSWFNAQNGKDNVAVCQKLNEIGESLSADFETRLVSQYQPFRLLHNKGIIIDDTVVVSSMNWVNTSFWDNREVGLEIKSREVAEYFATLFWKDWSIDPYPPVIVVPWKLINVTAGTLIVFDASASYDNSRILRYLWDLGGDGIVEWNGTRWLTTLEPGRKVVILTLADAYNNTASTKIYLNVKPADQERSSNVAVGAMLTGGCGTILYFVYKKIKSTR